MSTGTGRRGWPFTLYMASSAARSSPLEVTGAGSALAAIVPMLALTCSA